MAAEPDRPDDGPESPDGASPPSLMRFPMDFPIKIMGVRADTFADEVAAVLRRHAPDFDPATLEMRPSRQGTYLGLTATIRAVERDQLDALYRELTAHPLVKVVL